MIITADFGVSAQLDSGGKAKTAKGVRVGSCSLSLSLSLSVAVLTQACDRHPYGWLPRCSRMRTRYCSYSPTSVRVYCQLTTGGGCFIVWWCLWQSMVRRPISGALVSRRSRLPRRSLLDLSSISCAYVRSPSIHPSIHPSIQHAHRHRCRRYVIECDLLVPLDRPCSLSWRAHLRH